MDNDILIVAGSIMAVLVVVLAFRVSVLPAFFALVIGQLIVSYSGFGFFDQRIPDLIMLFGLFGLTVLLTHGRSHAKLSHELIPAFSLAIVFLLMLYPYVEILRSAFLSFDVFGIANSKMNIIIGLSILVLITTILGHRKATKTRKHQHHK